jgi:hypothetical protein
LRENLQCEGYDQSKIWIKYEAQQEDNDSAKLVAIRPHTILRIGRETESISSVGSETTLTDSTMETEILNAFWIEYLPKGVLSRSLNGSKSSNILWMEAITNLSERSDFLRQGLAAVSLACVGFKRYDQSLQQQGARMYGLAVAKLGQRLQMTAELPSKDNTLLPTCILLSTYEVCHPRAKTTGITDAKTSIAIQWFPVQFRNITGSKLAGA